ncbi:MAG: DNA repair protein RecO C-terminal domain-containing protein, partial [Solirubrobacteraceae bacterium]
PQLAACAVCGETEHLSGFSGAAGGVVCNACEAGAFSLSEDAYGFLVSALGSPLAQAPDGTELTLRQVERAIGDTAAHHAHVRLRPLLAA